MPTSLTTAWRQCLVAVLACTCLAGCGPGPAGPAPWSYTFERLTWTLRPPPKTDILFVIDNAGSMADKQAALYRSMLSFSEWVECFWPGFFRIAVVTTGFASDGCRPCAGLDDVGCLNETGESGRFQDRVGRLSLQAGQPVIEHGSDPACRVVDSTNLDCLHDPDDGASIALVGFGGCAYRRGLEAMRAALSKPLFESWNANFLRPDAELVVIVISDGEDCGEPGQVAEGIAGVDEAICSYAANGAGPDGGSFHPDDPELRPYQLTPVQEYYDFLMALKGDRTGLVKFAAIVGVDDVLGPEATVVRFDGAGPSASVLPACSLPDCTGEHCGALPGTRYIELASLFSRDWTGFVETICRENFFDSMPTCPLFSHPRSFTLRAPPLDPALSSLLFNGAPVAPLTCSAPGELRACQGREDPACDEAPCVQTWRYRPPQEGYDPPGGFFDLADHLDLGEQVALLGELRIELIYVIDR